MRKYCDDKSVEVRNENRKKKAEEEESSKREGKKDIVSVYGKGKAVIYPLTIHRVWFSGKWVDTCVPTQAGEAFYLWTPPIHSYKTSLVSVFRTHIPMLGELVKGC